MIFVTLSRHTNSPEVALGAAAVCRRWPEPIRREIGLAE
jgi:hypothetical protein